MKKMLFFKIAISAILFISMIFPYRSYAGDPTAYKVTVLSIQLKTSAGNWVTIASPNKELDIASVGAGAVAGSFAPDTNIPAGDYVNFKIVLSNVIRFSGSDGAGRYTRAGGTLRLAGNPFIPGSDSTATWTADPPIFQVGFVEGAEASFTADPAAQGEVTMTINLNLNNQQNLMEVLATNDLTTSISVKNNSTMSMFFDFNTLNTVHWIAAPGNVMYLLPPRQGTKFGITVDGTSYAITADTMKIDFY